MDAPLDEQPLDDVITEYDPPFAVVTLFITGFCKADVNPFGPVQLYVAPDTVDAVRFNIDPTHRGPLLPTNAFAGIAFTTTLVDAPLDEQPFDEVKTVYDPDAAVVTLVIVGFCNDEVNPLGPVQL